MKRLIILLLLISGCKSKQITTQVKETVKIDTVYKFKDRIIDRPVIDSIIIEKPCDSLGNLKPFKGVLKTNHTKVSVTADNGQIAVVYDQDSIISSNTKEREVKTESVKESIEDKKVIYKWPWWVVYLILYSALLTGLSGYLLFKRFF